MKLMLLFRPSSFRPGLVIPFVSLLASSSSSFSKSSFPSRSASTSLHARASSSSTRSTSPVSNTMPEERPFGAWESPISSKSITAGSVRLGQLRVHSDGRLYWMEGRPQEGGRNVLCRYDPSHPARSERGAVDVTPAGTNVRTRVHEYGGAAVTWGGRGEAFVSDFATQQLCRLGLGVGEDDAAAGAAGPPQPFTPDGNRFWFADGVYDATREVIFCVREDHARPAPADVVNEIVAVDAATGEMKVLVGGYDFCAAPRISPDGKSLACVVWDHPNMPWDATKVLKVALAEDVLSDGTIGAPVVVAGQDDDTSVIQPLVRHTMECIHGACHSP